MTPNGYGVYTAPSLPPGDYRIDVELAGFKPVRREGIRLATPTTYVPGYVTTQPVTVPGRSVGYESPRSRIPFSTRKR